MRILFLVALALISLVGGTDAIAKPAGIPLCYKAKAYVSGNTTGWAHKDFLSAVDLFAEGQLIAPGRCFGLTINDCKYTKQGCKSCDSNFNVAAAQPPHPLRRLFGHDDEDDEDEPQDNYRGKDKSCYAVLVCNAMKTDDLTFLFSTGKYNHYSGAMALFGQGVFNYSDKVSKYWPAYAQNGKQDITIEQFYSNGDCQPVLGKQITIDDLLLEELGGNPTNLCDAVAAAYPTTKLFVNATNPVDGCIPNFNYGYQPNNPGWKDYCLYPHLVAGKPGYPANAIAFRKQFFSQLPGYEVYEGLPPPAHSAWANATNARVRLNVASGIPTYNPNNLPSPAYVADLANPGSVRFQALFNPFWLATAGKWYNDPNLRKYIFPSANVYSNVQGLLPLAQAQANGGFLRGVRINWPDKIRNATQVIYSGYDYLIGDRAPSPTGVFVPTYSAFARAGFDKPNYNLVQNAEYYPIGSPDSFGHDAASTDIVVSEPRYKMAYALIGYVSDSFNRGGGFGRRTEIVVREINAIVRRVFAGRDTLY